MKWVAFLGAVFIVVPYVARRASASVLWRRWLVGLIAFSVFHSIDINLVSEEGYRGPDSGLEITFLDMMALALFIAQRLRRVPRPDGHLFAWSRRLYLIAVLLSVLSAPLLLEASFSVWKLVRMYFFFGVMVVELADLGQVRAALIGLGAGALSQAFIALEQRYVLGVQRVVGSQPHPNGLGALVNLVSPIALSLLLAGHWRRLNGVIVASCAVCAIMSLSRGAILMFGASSAVVVAGSLAKDFQGRKLVVVGSMMAAALALLAKSLDTILARFAEAPKASVEARNLFNRAAEAMAEARSFGIGINMYSHVLEHGGYADRFGLAPGDRSGVAHHIYWLTAAELGYVGLAAYVLMLAAVLLSALRAAWARDVRGDIALGIVAALGITYIQGTAEWILRQSRMSYAFWLLAAMVAAFRIEQRRTAGAAVGLAWGAHRTTEATST